MFVPKFWHNSISGFRWIAYFLLPLTVLWILGLKVKTFLVVPEKMPIPVVCVGNITLGGNGKTPSTLKIQKLLQKSGYSVHILSKGYRGSARGPILIDPHIHTFAEVGDEPLMMSHYAPTWISKNRRLGIKSAHAAGADIVIMDDGFQNNSIEKDLSIVVVDTFTAFGNELILPAGPLREPIQSGLERADFLITIGTKADKKRFHLNYGKFKLPLSVNASFIPQKENINLVKKKVVAIAGIGHPKKFFASLEKFGAIIVYAKAFPNHQPFHLKALKKLISLSHKERALLITTEKDFVRLPQALRPLFTVFKVEILFEDEALLMKTITQRLGFTKN